MNGMKEKGCVFSGGGALISRKLFPVIYPIHYVSAAQSLESDYQRTTLIVRCLSGPALLMKICNFSLKLKSHSTRTNLAKLCQRLELEGRNFNVAIVVLIWNDFTLTDGRGMSVVIDVDCINRMKWNHLLKYHCQLELEILFCYRYFLGKCLTYFLL